MILLISAVFPPEPLVSANILHDLADTLSDDHEVTVLTPRPSRPFGFPFGGTSSKIKKFQQIILNSYISPKSNPIGRIIESYSFGIHASRYIKKHRCMINCIYIDTWPLLSQYFIVRTVKKYSILSIIHIDDIYPESFSNKIFVLGPIIKKLLLPLDKFILRNVTKVIAISKSMQIYLSQTRRIPRDKIEVIFNWRDDREFNSINKSPSSLNHSFSEKRLFKFMYLGNIGPVAGVDFLIKSFAKANIKEAKLVIAGHGSKKNKCLVLASKYKDLKIEFWDVPKGKVAEIQDQADVMLLPIKRGAAHSSVPSKLSGYMYSKKPVIACTDEESDTANTILSARCGWILPPENISLLADKMTIISTLSNYDLQRLGLNGYDFASEQYSKKRNLQKLVEIIKTTINKSSLSKSVLLVAATFPPEPGVSANLAYDLALKLSENFKVKVLTPKPSRPLGFDFNNVSIKNDQFEQIILNSYTCPKPFSLGRIRESNSFGNHVAKYISKHNSEFYGVYIDAWPLLAQYKIVKTVKKYSIPSIIHIDDIYPESLHEKLPVLENLIIKLLFPLDKWVLNNSSRIVTISEGMKHFLISSRKLEERKVDVVYNWQNEKSFIEYKITKGNESKDKIFTFMFLGNLNITAAIDTLILAFNISEIKNARLVIAGNGSEKNNLISISKNIPESNIEFWDAPLYQVPSIQDQADVLIINLRKGAAKFSLPSKLVAYMLSQKPIIACVEVDSETAKTIKNANCGWVSPPEDIQTLSKLMRTVVSIKKFDLQDYGKNGFEYMMKNFSRQNNFQKLISIINETFNC